MSIRLKLTLWYGAVFGLLFLAVGGFLALRLDQGLRQNLDQALRVRAADVINRLGDQEIDFQDQPPPAVASPLSGVAENYAQILDLRGRIVEGGEAVPSGRALASPELVRAALKAPVGFDTDIAGVGGVRALAIADRSQNPRYVIVVATRLEQMDEARRRLVFLLGLALPVAGAIALGGGYAIARWGLRPVTRMAEEAAAIGASDAAVALTVPKRNDEVGRLGRTLNDLLARLRSSLERQRFFATQASHELRTPLAIMQAEAALALKGEASREELRAALSSNAEEVQRLTALVEGLLATARAEGEEIKLERVDVAAVLSEAIDPLKSAATNAAVAIDVESPHFVIGADRARLVRAVANLVDNAIRHAPPASAVEVRAVPTVDGLEISVADRGPGVPADARTRIFEPFARLTSHGPGRAGASGLGLALVAAVARAHGGKADVRDRPGGGAVFTLRLPRTEPQEDGAASADTSHESVRHRGPG